MFQDIDRTVRLSASADATWSTLLDFERVASWLAVVHDVREVQPLKRYTTVLQDRVGPFAMKADLAIDVAADPATRTLRVSGSGDDRQIASRISASLDVTVTSESDGCALRVKGRYEITGRIATLGAGAIRKKGDKVLEDFFTKATAELGGASPSG